MKNVGQRIRELRREIDCTQNVLADFLGVTQDSISLWENEKRIPDTQYIVAMSEFFDVSADYLLGISDEIVGIRFEEKKKMFLTEEEENMLIKYRSLSEEERKNLLSKI